MDLDDLERATARLALGAAAPAAGAPAAGHTGTAPAAPLAAFCTMGIGQPRKVPRAEFQRVDVDYAAAFARGARSAGAARIALLSAVGADPRSRNWYLAGKGGAEQAVAAAGIAHTSVFRPSLLVTRRIRYGVQDWLARTFVPLAAPLLPARYHQIRVEDLARAMRVDAERPGAPGTHVLTYADFARLAGGTLGYS